MSARLRCGVVGLGNMGRGIAANMESAEMLAAVWDTDAERRRSCRVSDGVGDGIAAVAGCDIILLAVPGSAEIADLFDAGLLDGACGTVLVDLTTSHPSATRTLAARAAAAGARYLDAGMTGGAAGAQSGRLTLMMGGDESALAQARPALDRIAARIFHLGPSGAGHSMKLVHNMVCHTIFLATVEGCRAAERAGIPLDRAVEVLNAGNARSFVSERRFVDSIVSGQFDGRSHTANLAKDLAMAKALFAELDQPSAYVGLTASLLAEALSHGLGAEDFTRLYLNYDAVVQALTREP